MKLELFCAILSASVLGAQGAFQPLGSPFIAPVSVAPGLSAAVIFSNLTSPRGIVVDSHENLLVVERGFGITAFSPTNSPSNGWLRTVVIENSNFTHGIQVDGNKLYASTAEETLVYSYNPAEKSVSGSGQVIINNFPLGGELTTHTLQLERTSQGKNILIGTGPFTNIDPTARDPSSGRSQIRRFSLSSEVVQPFVSGELVAYGIRNPAGFAFSPAKSLSSGSILHVVENGASIDDVTGLTAEFVNDNPADAIKTVDLSSDLESPFGFPDCATIWNPQADSVGNPQYVNFTVGQQFSLNLQADRNDTWCANPTNNRPPALSFQAHSVPLDIKFQEELGSKNGSFKWQGDAFVSFHGSFNRAPPTGYGVVHIPFSGEVPSSQDYAFLIQAQNLTSCPGSCIRPAGLAFGRDVKLYATSDSSGELFVLERTQG